MDDEMGAVAVRAARTAVNAYVNRKEVSFPFPATFNRMGGAFVTLRRHPSRDLRGCIGYPEPVMPLKDSIWDAAQAACRDPRFHPLSRNELDTVTVEVTILTPPEPLQENTRTELPQAIQVGVDGLMIQKGPHRGLLLPQVPVEWGWDAETFLDNLCLKAGLAPGSWRQDSVRLWRFQGSIFSEQEPNGSITKTG
ncbi:MAG: TIGR00296 family protein [Candidatus Methanomethylophilaceae archaeon]